MKIKKTVTDKQFAANRRNALHSTGPKTNLGKKASARNALKHGLLASEIVIDGGDGRENRAEFDALLQGLCEYFSPEGTLEELLVERVAVCYWRIRRAIRCELGETRKQLDSAAWDDENNRARNFTHAKTFAELDRSGLALKASSRGINYLIGLLEGARYQAEVNGEISEIIQKRLDAGFGVDETSPAIMCAVLADKLKGANNGGESKEGFEIEKQHLLDFLRRNEKELQELLKVVEKKERLQLQAHVRSLSLPAPETLDRIVRYETTAERQFYRALDQLERIQRQRKGDQVPSPLRLSVATD